MAKRPLIGVTSLFDSGKDSMWMLPGYVKSVEAAGGIPLILPFTTDEEVIDTIVNTLDGILITGGQDVDPRLYGENILKYCGEVCFLRDETEKILIKKMVERDKPILGICRGIQILNVVFGGTLYQDIDKQKERDQSIEHEQKFSPKNTVHSINLDENSMLYECIRKLKVNVNSLHHQGIKELSSSFNAVGVSDDGIIEAIEMKNAKFVSAVQWHPEFMWEKDEDSINIFKFFIDKCK